MDGNSLAGASGVCGSHGHVDVLDHAGNSGLLHAIGCVDKVIGADPDHIPVVWVDGPTVESSIGHRLLVGAGHGHLLSWRNDTY